MKIRSTTSSTDPRYSSMAFLGSQSWPLPPSCTDCFPCTRDCRGHIHHLLTITPWVDATFHFLEEESGARRGSVTCQCPMSVLWQTRIRTKEFWLQSLHASTVSSTFLSCCWVILKNFYYVRFKTYTKVQCSKLPCTHLLASAVWAHSQFYFSVSITASVFHP